MSVTPRYIVPDAYRNILMCSECGAAVYNLARHTAWHEDLDRTLKLKINRETTMDGEQL